MEGIQGWQRWDGHFLNEQAGSFEAIEGEFLRVMEEENLGFMTLS